MVIVPYSTSCPTVSVAQYTHNPLQLVFSIPHHNVQLLFPCCNLWSRFPFGAQLRRSKKWFTFLCLSTLGFSEDSSILQTKSLKEGGGKSVSGFVHHQNSKLSGDIGGGAGEGSKIGFQIDTLSLEFHNHFCCMMMRIGNMNVLMKKVFWIWNLKEGKCPFH